MTLLNIKVGRLNKKIMKFLSYARVGLCLIIILTPMSAQALSQAQKDSLGSGAYYFNTEDCSSQSSDSGGQAIVGDLKQLAQKILSNNNISFDYGPSGPTGSQFKLLASGQKAQTDDGREVNVQPIILVTILRLAQGHRVNVSALTNGDSHTSPTSPHGMGEAVDINMFDDSHTDGSDAVAYGIINTAATVLPANSRFGMGDNPFGTKQISGKTFISFKDNHDHVHIDVVGVSQAAMDAAVQAAGAGTISSPAACCGNQSSGPLVGSTNAEKAYNYFIQAPRNLSPQAAAGIVGNMMKESGGNSENLDTHAHNDLSGTHDGIVQWSTSRWASLQAHEQGKDIYALSTQLDYVWYELGASYKSVLSDLKTASTPEKAATIFNERYEASGDTSGAREDNARKIFVKYGGGNSTLGGAIADCANTQDADMQKTITVSSRGKFITLPTKYSCPGRTTTIDSRLAADIAYLVNKFNLCADDGLANGHLSHGAGVAVDMRPRNGNDKVDWKNSAEAAARAMGWYGDSADGPKTQSGCAKYVPGQYGQCMHETEPNRFPLWLRWLGYNGDYQHGDPWHIYGGSYAHIHIGWDTPNHDGVSETIISQPRESVYAFPAPLPDDLKNLVN
jgi:hypothetical protein